RGRHGRKRQRVGRRQGTGARRGGTRRDDQLPEAHEEPVQDPRMVVQPIGKAGRSPVNVPVKQRLATMRHAAPIAAVMLTVVLGAAGSADAGFGAIAYYQDNGKLGSSFDQSTPALANEQALKKCASPGCRVHPVEPKGCGALALSDKDKAWGGADRETL